MNESEKIREELSELTPGLPYPAPAAPFEVPAGYFSTLPEKLTKTIQADMASSHKSARILSLNYFFLAKVAAAAITVGMIVFSAFHFINSNTTDISKDPQLWVSKEVRKVSNERLKSFLELTHNTVSHDEDSEGLALNTKEMASLVEDIPNEEIKSLLNDLTTDDGRTGFSNE